MEAVKNFFGLGASTEGQAGAPVPPPAVTPASRPATAAANKLAALAPAVSAPVNASAKKTVTLPTTGGMSDFIGGRRKNLRKKYKMPGRRSATRKNRKANAVSRKARKATRKNRKASRKARN